MAVGGGGDGSMVGDCGPMGMSRGFDGPMIVVEVRRGSWVTDLLGFRLCDGFWFTDLRVMVKEVFFFFGLWSWFWFSMSCGSPIYWVCMCDGFWFTDLV